MSFKSLTILATAALGLFAGAAQAQVPGLANMGFEQVANGSPVGEFANGWMPASVAPGSREVTRSTTEFKSGAASAFLTITDGNPGGVGLFQNSVDHGQLAAVDPLNWGTSPTFSFWYKGNVSETGNLNYALRYLSASGTILSTGFGSVTVITGNVDRPWTQFTRTPNTVIPVNTAAVFVEMTLAAGPSGTFAGCGGTCVWGTPAVYIDDMSITLANPVPEPGTYALMLAGLACVGGIAARRRRAA